MPEFKKHIIYTHHDANIQTVGQFLDNLGLSIAKDLTIDEFLNYYAEYEDPANPDKVVYIRNFDHIVKNYDAKELETYCDVVEDGGDLYYYSNGQYPNEALPFLLGTKVAIPKTQMFTEVALISGFDQTIPTASEDNVMSDNLKALLSDPGYYPIDKLNFEPGQGTLNRQYPNVSVWVWCRALSPESSDYISFDKRNSLPDFTEGGSFEDYQETRRKLAKHFGMDGNLIDISPFVINLNTSVDASGGNFSMQLAPIEGERDASAGWRPTEKTIQAINAQEFIAQAKVNKYDFDEEKFNRTNFLLHTIIQPNDLVFIRFETLIAEEDRQDPNEEWEYLINKSEIAGKNYDMIALVDQNTIRHKSQGGVEVSIDVVGRDLSKLLNEDGSYFYPMAYTNYAEPEIGDQKQLRRMTITGKYPLFGEYAYRGIQYSIEFIINQVSNITVVPDNLFTSYGDRVSKTLQISAQSEEAIKKEKERIRKYIEELFESSMREDGTWEEADPGNPTDATNQNEINRERIAGGFTDMYKFIKDIAQKGQFVYNRDTFNAFSWFAGTYNGNTVGIARFPPTWRNTYKLFGKTTSFNLNGTYQDANGQAIEVDENYGKANFFFDESVRQMIKLVLLEDSLLPYEPEPMPGIWQIIKLVFSEKVDQYRLADPSIAQPDGPLMNHIKKICQEPFVEFFGDTHGDFFHFTTREPPFSKEAIRRYASNFYQGDSYFRPSVFQAENDTRNTGPDRDPGTINIETSGRRPSFLIDILEEDVLDDNLNFYDGEVYTWFELVPQSSFLGQGSEVTTGYIPIFQIPEYAEIFGAKRLRVVNQYYRFDGHWRLPSFVRNDVITQAAFDMEWLVQTNALLPFTRQGSITINGDRTIKRGTYVRYTPTNEIFYVTAVQHNYQIGQTVDRTTILQVERGMVESFIEGVEVTNSAGDSFIAGYFNIIEEGSVYSFISSFATNFNYAGKVAATAVNKDVINFFLKRNQFKPPNETDDIQNPFD